jgi:hypothetical protein
MHRRKKIDAQQLSVYAYDRVISPHRKRDSVTHTSERRGGLQNIGSLNAYTDTLPCIHMSVQTVGKAPEVQTHKRIDACMQACGY